MTKRVFMNLNLFGDNTFLIDEQKLHRLLWFSTDNGTIKLYNIGPVLLNKTPKRYIPEQREETTKIKRMIKTGKCR
jgi:hypothetical protein